MLDQLAKQQTQLDAESTARNAQVEGLHKYSKVCLPGHVEALPGAHPQSPPPLPGRPVHPFLPGHHHPLRPDLTPT